MLAEGLISLTLMAPLSSPGPDPLHRPSWGEWIEYVCDLTPGQNWIYNRAGAEINLRLHCSLIEESAWHREWIR